MHARSHTVTDDAVIQLSINVNTRCKTHNALRSIHIQHPSMRCVYYVTIMQEQLILSELDKVTCALGEIQTCTVQDKYKSPIKHHSVQVHRL